MKELHLSPFSSHSLIPTQQEQRRQRRRSYEEVENRHNAYNPCIFSPFLQFFRSYNGFQVETERFFLLCAALEK